MPRRPLVEPRVWLESLNDALGSGPTAVGGSETAEAPAYPVELHAWLTELSRLHRVPFHYLAPLEEMLPEESVRFFFVDPEWTDHLVQGALSASAVGTREQDPMEKMLAATRDGLRKENGRLGEPVTGFLLRSVAVRRWPRMEIRAWRGGVGLRRLRQQRISRGVMIYLMCGVPDRMEIEEPNEGTQFGVEAKPDAPGTFDTQVRDDDGSFKDPMVRADVPMRPGSRVLRIERFRWHLAVALGLIPPVVSAATGVPATVPERALRTVGSARIALSLQQTPYVQKFEPTAGSAAGGPVELAARLNDALARFRSISRGRP